MSDRENGAAGASSDFTLVGYRTLLEALLARGYQGRSFADAGPDCRHLVLRHDLDMTLDAASPMAEVEHALGLRAVYFVLLRTEFYNLHTPRARAALRHLIDLGHHIGLHFDASLYDQEAVDGLDRAAEVECANLEDIVAAPVRMISFHRPAPALVGLDRLLAGRDHAYRPRYVSDMGYCSDSRGAWHHGHPFDHGAVAAGRALQLLTHPVWWTGTADEDPVAKLERFLSQRLAFLQQELAANCEPYRRQMVAFSDRNITEELRSGVPMRLTTLDTRRICAHMREFVHIADDVPGEYWRDEHFLMTLPDKWVLSFAIWSAERPIAYAILSRKTPNHVHLHHFMISAPFRGSGLGSVMIKEMLSRAQRIGAHVLTLKAAKTNIRVCEFYRSHGFSIADTTGDYLTLRKELTTPNLGLSDPSPEQSSPCTDP